MYIVTPKSRKRRNSAEWSPRVIVNAAKDTFSVLS